MNFDVEFVEGHPIPKIAIKAVGLFDQHGADVRVRLQIADHLFEIGAAGRVRRFDVDIVLGDDKVVVGGVALQKFLLRRNGEAFLLLLLGRDARIGERLARFGADRSDFFRFHCGLPTGRVTSRK